MIVLVIRRPWVSPLLSLDSCCDLTIQKPHTRIDPPLSGSRLHILLRRLEAAGASFVELNAKLFEVIIGPKRLKGSIISHYTIIRIGRRGA